MQKIVIIAAPSGSGKTTIVRNLLSHHNIFGFSVSCTTRQPRGMEQHGIDYYYISENEFKQKIENDEFLEWENVYEGLYYGTLKSEIERIHAEGKWPLLDIDVVGAVKLREKYGKEQVLSIFIQPPSIEELRNRLVKRATDSPETIEKRIQKARYELEFASRFDHVVINDVLEKAIEDLIQILKQEAIINE